MEIDDCEPRVAAQLAGGVCDDDRGTAEERGQSGQRQRGDTVQRRPRRSDDISGDSCGVDQVRRERWKRGAPTAACGAQAEVGGSVTSSRGATGCTASKVEQEDTVR
uniref:Uncharacterized protein n=1 Tax=Oryza barthii TaxID=65489 RepID=A0A0D3GLN2_9ORYZ